MTSNKSENLMDEDIFNEIECCICLEPIDDSDNNLMLVSYVYNQYAHISCYWQYRLDNFIPKESLQDLMITIIDKDDESKDEIALSGIVTDTLNAIIPVDMQRQVVDGYNERFVKYCRKQIRISKVCPNIEPEVKDIMD